MRRPYDERFDRSEVMTQPLQDRIALRSRRRAPRTRPITAVHRRRTMPDIAETRTVDRTGDTLDRVGMRHIEVPVRLAGGDGSTQIVPARAGAFVDLADPHAKGIHMSRLFLHLQEGLESGPLDWPLVELLLRSMRESHADLSTEAHLELEFDWMTKRAALVSEHAGWRAYPIRIAASLTPEGLTLRLGTTVTYSSTCPCSAALARQLIQEAFDRDFDGAITLPAHEVRAWLARPSSICATPHGQRSEARVLVQVDSADEGLQFPELVGLVEESLGTVVQAAVKREDEQAFALLNGQNPMFCEDAARRVKRTLDRDRRITDYRVRCEHLESLHPHDAVCVVTKGVPGGLRA